MFTINKRDSRRRISSPRARAAMNRLGIDSHSISGTGPAGRIVESDVLLFSIEKPNLPEPPPVHLPASGMRAAIARKTAESFATIPHFYLKAEVEVSALIQLKNELGPEFEQMAGVRLSLTDLLIRAQAMALHRCPTANAIWQEGNVVSLSETNVGLVVSIPGGLLIPVISNAGSISLANLGKTRFGAAEEARAGRCLNPQMTCATSLSNLGRGAIDEFSAVIPLGQSSILAVGNTKNRAWDVDGRIEARPTVKLTLSADHRVLDGQPAAEYLDAIVSYLSSPLVLLLGF